MIYESIHKSEFTKYIQPSYQTKATVFILKKYLSEEVREEADTIEELNKLFSRLD